MQQFRIQRFDPSTIKPYRIHLLVGKRGCGKTTLLNDLLYNMRSSVDFAMAMCPTIESASLLRRSLPECCVFDRFVPSKIDQLVSLAQNMAHSNKRRHILLIADDCLYDKSVLKSSAIRNLFFNGRNYFVTFIILAQYVMDLPPDLRTQIDYLYVMRENIVTNRIRIYKYLFGCVQNFEDFCALMDRCTQNFECLCLDNTLQTSKVQECVFWYKAQVELPSFRVGSRVFHALDERYKLPKDRRCAPGTLYVEETCARPKPRLTVVKEEDDPDSVR